VLGKTGVGKSTFGNQLLGNPYMFEVGHDFQRSKTSEIKAATGQYLGRGTCVTVIDTPGFDDTRGKEYDHKHSQEMQQYLKDNYDSINIFLLLIKGSDTRFDDSLDRMLQWYEEIFGKDFWKHVVVEVTFWKHTAKAKKERKADRDGLEEIRYSKDVQKALNDTFKFNLKLPVVFVDPVMALHQDKLYPRTLGRHVNEPHEEAAFLDWAQQ